MRAGPIVAAVAAIALVATTTLLWYGGSGPVRSEGAPSHSPQELLLTSSSHPPAEAARRSAEAESLDGRSVIGRPDGAGPEVIRPEALSTRQLTPQELRHAENSVRKSIQHSEERLRKIRSRPIHRDIRRQYRELQEELSEQRDLELMREALIALGQGRGCMLRTGHTPESVAGNRRFYARLWNGPESPFQGILVVLSESNSSLDDLELSFREARRAEAELSAREFNQQSFELRRAAVDMYAQSGVPASIGMEHEFMGLVDVDLSSATLRVRH